MSVTSRVVSIRCRGAETLPLDEIQPFQGDLKRLTPENLRKLERVIQRHGFSEPISVWRAAADAPWQALNGHQRLIALKALRSDGWEVPEIPVSIIEAKNEKEAKEKVLALTAQYGEITKDGLSDFVLEAEIDLSFLEEHLRFPEVDLSIFSPKDEKDIKKAAEEEGKSAFIIVIECVDESEQAELFEELMTRGKACRLIA